MEDRRRAQQAFGPNQKQRDLASEYGSEDPDPDLNRVTYSHTRTPWGTSEVGGGTYGRRFARVTVRATTALLFPPRCSNKNEQKQLEMLLAEKKEPAQNEAFQDWINRQISCFSGKLIPAQVQSDL